MLTIHATKKLYAKLPLNSDGSLSKTVTPRNEAQTDNPLSGWHANLLTLQRRNCVLLVHDATRFPLFIKSLVKADFRNFQWHFEDALMNTLLKLDANQQQLDNAANLLAPCRFDTICDRSVQGTMNRRAGDIEHLLWYDNVKLEEISAYRLSAMLAEYLCTVKNIKEPIWPQREMLKLLSTSDAAPDISTTENNIIQFSDYKKR